MVYKHVSATEQDWVAKADFRNLHPKDMRASELLFPNAEAKLSPKDFGKSRAGSQAGEAIPNHPDLYPQLRCEEKIPRPCERDSLEDHQVRVPYPAGRLLAVY